MEYKPLTDDINKILNSPEYSTDVVLIVAAIACGENIGNFNINVSSITYSIRNIASKVLPKDSEDIRRFLTEDRLIIALKKDSFKQFCADQITNDKSAIINNLVFKFLQWLDYNLVDKRNILDYFSGYNIAQFPGQICWINGIFAYPSREVLINAARSIKELDPHVDNLLGNYDPSMDDIQEYLDSEDFKEFSEIKSAPLDPVGVSAFVRSFTWWVKENKLK